MALRRLIPYPALTRYTVVTMVPRKPWIYRITAPFRMIANAASRITTWNASPPTDGAGDLGLQTIAGLGIAVVAVGMVAMAMKRSK
jgi:hypothetical protein